MTLAFNRREMASGLRRNSRGYGGISLGISDLWQYQVTQLAEVGMALVYSIVDKRMQQ